MSKNGWLGPMSSSWSLGPDPETRTTAGKGPLPLGSVSVPLRGGEPTPTASCLMPRALGCAAVVVVVVVGASVVTGRRRDGGARDQATDGQDGGCNPTSAIARQWSHNQE